MAAPKRMHRGIALLVTLFFIMAITAALGISLTLLQEGNEKTYAGRFLVQTSALTEDVVTLLKSSEELATIEDAVGLNLLLEGASMIPFATDSVEVLVSMRSEMGKININTLASSKAFQIALNDYLLRYNVQDVSYLSDLMIDCMSGVRPYYRSDIFEYHPDLYRNRIADTDHLEKVLEFYTRMRHDNSVNDVPWEQLVRFDTNSSAGIDVNYVSAELWQLLLPNLPEDVAIELADNPLVYESLDDLGLSEYDLKQLEAYQLSVFEPKIKVALNVVEHNRSAIVTFDYDLQSKTVKEFTYGI